MRNHLVVIMACLLTGMLVACGGGGSSSSSSGKEDPGDLNPPVFYGVKAISTAGGAYVRLDWDPAQDDVTPQAGIVYRIYRALATGGQNYNTPIFTTGPGATSVVLDASVGTAVGQTGFYAVRAVDGAGNQDMNEVELTVTTVNTANVAFVSNTAGGPGTLGDPTDPYTTIQDAVVAVEGIGGGAILVDAANGGTTYAEEIDFTANVTEIGLFGSFGRFSTLPANPTGGQILATRDLDATPTILSEAGLFPLTGDDLVRIENGGAMTLVDGFEFAGVRQEIRTLTGTFNPARGNDWVEATGAQLVTEFPSQILPVLIRFNGEGTLARVESVSTGGTDQLRLMREYRGVGGPQTATIFEDPVPAVRAEDAKFQLSGSHLKDGAFLLSDTTSPNATSSVRIVGNRATGDKLRAFVVAGGMDLLRIQGNRTHWVTRSVDCEGALDENSDPTEWLTRAEEVFVPTTGLAIYLTHNIFDSNYLLGEGIDMLFLDFGPTGAVPGGPLMVEISYNETRNTTNDAYHLENLLNLGDGGSLTVNAHHNLFNGTASESLYLGGLDETMYPGVGSTIHVWENAFPNSNGNPLEIDTSVAAGETTSITIEDNLFGVTESEMIEVDDESDGNGTVGAHDGGIFRVELHRNVGFGGAEDMEIDVGYTMGGRTTINATENTINGTEDPGISIGGGNQVGDSNTPSAFPDAVLVVRVFNNDLEGEEVMEIDDQRGGSANANSLGIYYIGHNTARSEADGSDGAIEFESRARWVAALIERNFTGGGGQDTSEAGIEVDSSSSGTGSVRILNNVATMASGGGFTFDPVGPQCQVINNTAAYGAQNSCFGFENDWNDAEGDLQAYILNCIASHNGGGDAEEEDGVRPFWSLVRDQTPPAFPENLDGEPFYAKDFSDLMALGKIHDNAEFANLFTLRPTSPAVDRGHPDARYNDPDGSRNDMGAFGGPNAGPLGVRAAGAVMPFVFVGSPHARLWTGNPVIGGADPVWLAFNKPVTVAALNAAVQFASGFAVIAGDFAVIGDGYAASFTPRNPWPQGVFVDVTIGGGMTDAAGQNIAYPEWVRFATLPASTAEVEPNDDGTPGVGAGDFVAAQVLGAGPSPSVFQLNGSVAAAEELDVYSFQASQFDRLNVTIFDARAGGLTEGNFEIHLYDATGQRLVRSRRDAFWGESNGTSYEDPYLDHTFAAAGTYYLVVFNATANTYPANYDMAGTIDK